MTRDSILNLVNTDPDVMRAVLIGGEDKHHDNKLQGIVITAGQIGLRGYHDLWLSMLLRDVYGQCVGWLMSLGAKDITAKINAERERQEEKLKAGDFLFNCASKHVGPGPKLRVLTEEIGEAAEAIDKWESSLRSSQGISDHVCKQRLVDEVVQIAAVSVAWLESLEVA